MRVPEPGLWGWSPARFPVRQDARNLAGGAESAPRLPGTAVSSASSQPHARQKGRGALRACGRGAEDTT